MNSWVKVGVKCICVDAAAKDGFTPPLIQEGHIYTIRDVGISPINGDCGVRLVEFGATAFGFLASRFQPLITKTQEQDVSMFKSLLNKTPIKETA